MIAVLGVFEIEIDPLKKNLHILETGEIVGRTFYRGVVGPNEVVTTYGFIGKVETALITQAVIDKFHPTAVIFTGAAGALSNFLKIGDIVIGDEYFEYDLGRRDGKVEIIEASVKLVELVEEHIDWCVVGRIATGDSFIQDEDLKRHIRKLTGAIAVDMDSAAMAKVCKENKVPFVAVKTIVDACSVEEFHENYTTLAKRSSSKLIKIINHHSLMVC